MEELTNSTEQCQTEPSFSSLSREERADLAKRYQAMMSTVSFVVFDKKTEGSFNNYKYASAGAVLAKVNRGIGENGFCLRERKEILSDSVLKIRKDVKGKIVEKDAHRVVAVCYLSIVDIFTGVTVASSVAYGQGLDYGDKAYLKANTVCYKYAVSHALCLGWGAEDPEADHRLDDDIHEDAPRGFSSDAAPVSAKAPSFEELDKDNPIRKSIMALAFASKGESSETNEQLQDHLDLVTTAAAKNQVSIDSYKMKALAKKLELKVKP